MRRRNIHNKHTAQIEGGVGGGKKKKKKFLSVFEVFSASHNHSCHSVGLVQIFVCAVTCVCMYKPAREESGCHRCRNGAALVKNSSERQQFAFFAYRA
jgi:hypothetical protein